MYTSNAEEKTLVNRLQTFYPYGVKRLVVYSFTSHQKQESHAVAENYRRCVMRGTCTESLHLVLGQRSE